MAGPDSWDDYIAIGKWLIYKKLVVAIVLILFTLLMVAIIYILFMKGVIPPFWQKSEAAVAWEELIINDDGLVVIVVENVESAFTGLGQVDIGNELRFEGIFKNGRFPSRGKISNAEGVLLYEGSIINGNVNTLDLLNMQAIDWRTAIKEQPEIYLYQNYMGYLFPQLGICGIEVMIEERPSDNLDGSLSFQALLLDGMQYSPQLQLNYNATDSSEQIQIPFFESLLAVRMRSLRDTTIESNMKAFAVDTGNGIYRVMTASVVLERGMRIWGENQSVFVWDNDWYIGNVPQVIHYQRHYESDAR